MPIITLNPVPAKQPNKNSSANTTNDQADPGAFQKILGKQVSHQEEQEGHTEVAQSSLDKSVDIDKQDSTHISKLRSFMNTKAHVGSKSVLEKNINSKDRSLAMEAPRLGENYIIDLPESAIEPKIDIDKTATGKSPKSKADESLQEPATFMTNGQLQPIVNVINITANVQSKLSRPSLEQDESRQFITGMEIIEDKPKKPEIPDSILLKKDATRPALEVEGLSFEKQISLSKNLELENKPSKFNLDLETKLSTQSAVAMPVNLAIVPMTASTNSLIPAGGYNIQPKLGTPEWDESVGQKIVWMVGTEQQSATLMLNPPDLGPLQVVIQVHNQMADTTFISQNPEVRQALEDSLSNLRHLMTDSGIQLGQANVHSNHQAEQQFQKQAQSQTHAGRATTTDHSDTVTTNVSKSYVSNGLVDTFA